MTEKSKLEQMCAHCDAALPKDAKFCPACGVSTGETTTFEEAKAFVMNGAAEAEKTARDLMKNEDAQKIAGAAAVGAVASLLLPISIVTGAVIGGGIMAYNRFAKQG
jgi:hypothetical protein